MFYVPSGTFHIQNLHILLTYYFNRTVSPIKAQRIQGPGVPEVTGADPAAPETVLATGNATLTTAAQGAGNSSELTNKEAERALMGVKAKLASDLSVERHVNDLIQTATNPENLARMFPGELKCGIR